MASTEVENYYDIFVKYLLAVGYHQAIVKLGINSEDGIYPVKKVARDHGYEGANLHREIIKRDNERWERLNNLNYWSQRVGFKPIREVDKDRIMKFLEDADRRRYVRDNVRRAAKQDKLLSIADLITMRLEVERKNRTKKDAKNAEKDTTNEAEK